MTRESHAPRIPQTTAELAALDQQIANLERLTVSGCDDATLKSAAEMLAEAREIRENVKGKLRAE